MISCLGDLKLAGGWTSPPAAISYRSDPQRGPGRLTTRRRTQTWCSLFVAPCAPEGTPRPFTRCGLAGGVFSSCPGRVGYRSSAVPKWFSRSPL